MTAAGAPVAGAQVVALEAPSSSPFEQPVQDGASPLAVAATDAEGNYILDLHEYGKGYGLVTIRVIASGYTPAAVTAAFDEPAEPVVLRPAAMVEGRVTAQGKPVEGAEVTGIGDHRSAMSVTTDANGRYRMPDPRLWAAMLGVRHRDYAPAWTAATNRDFALEPGKTVEGRVVDAQERAVAGARVELWPWSVATTTADDGTFRFQHVTVETSHLRASAPGGIAMQELVNGRQTLKLAPAARISGVIRDGEKHPLSGIRIVTQSQTINGDEAVSGRDGTFSLTVPRGVYGLVDADNGIYGIAGDANAKEGDVRVELVATRRTAIEGAVRDAKGDGVPGAMVAYLMARPEAAEMEAATAPATTVSGAGGRFRLRTPGEAGRRRMVAVKPGLPIGNAAVTDAHARAMVITLPAGVPLDGRVVDSSQHPVKGVAIRLRIGTPIAGEGPLELPEAWATTGADGRFHGLMGEGGIAFTFMKEGYSSAEQVVDVRAGMKPVDVTLVPATHVAGRVVQKDGTPAAGVKVAIDTSSVTSGEDGSFRIENVLAGEHAIVFGVPFPQRQSVNAPADDVKLVLPSMRTVRGRVVDAASGAPIDTFSLLIGGSIPDIDDPHTKAFESPAGDFVIELPETVTSLVAVAEGYLAADVDLTPSADPLVVRLSHGRTIRGRVLDEGGQPLGSVRVTNGFNGISGDETDDAEGTVHSADDGSFEMSGVPVDRDVQLEFRKRGFVRLMLRVRSGNDAAQEVVLRRGVSVHGRVVDAGGVTVAGAVVGASSAAHGAESGTAMTDDGGEFHFDALLPARWDFVVRHQDSGRRGAAKDIDIEKVQELTIPLDRTPTATISGHVSGLEPSWSMRYVEAQGADAATGRAEIDAAGNYHMEHAPAGTVEVTAIAGPTVDMAGLARHTKSVSVDVASGSEVRIDLAFQPQVAVHGRVTRGGAPLAGATVQFGVENALADGSGMYSCPVTPDEYDVTILVNNRQLPFAQHVVVIEPAELNFSVDVATIGVTVVDNGGQPLGGATVTAAPHGQTHTTAEAKSGTDGTATLEVAAGETETIGASLRGFANASQDVVAGGNASITLQLIRSPGAVVRIIDVRDGRTLSGYAIARDASGRVLASANEADADGTMTLPLAPGTYRFSASAENYGSHTIQAEVPSGEIRLPLPRGGKLALRANASLRATARLLQPNGEEYVRCWCSGVAEITLNGVVTIVDQIAPGSYTLEVTPAGGKPRTYPVTVTEGMTTAVTVE